MVPTKKLAVQAKGGFVSKIRGGIFGQKPIADDEIHRNLAQIWAKITVARVALRLTRCASKFLRIYRQNFVSFFFWLWVLRIPTVSTIIYRLNIKVSNMFIWTGTDRNCHAYPAGKVAI